MTFHILSLDQVPEIIFKESCQWCSIKIENFSEKFIAPLNIWAINKYQSQWKHAIKKIVEGHSKSYLVASMRDPFQSDFISIYCLYREKDRIFIQNKIIFCKDNEQAILKCNLKKLMGNRKLKTNDRVKISEWQTSIKSLQEYLVQVKGGKH
ncbi:MAG: hypothetical protein HRU36_01655 [Rickettsiales bacterium]|nr:hypothetical protein [Rickettsiales bacterium]